MMAFAGASLDLIKTVAAVLMLGDHINSALVEPPALLVWRFGRIAFPLFCFVLASHMARGMDTRTHVARLLVFGALTQPIFTAAFPWSPREANILFTLAGGAALAQSLAGRPSWLQHGTFVLGALVIWWWPTLARTGVDFGLAGILFPAALTLLLKGEWLHGPWVVVLLLALNYGAKRPGGEALVFGVGVDGVYAGLGSLCVVACAAAVSGRPRFLPRYALYAFYPGHLLALALWRAWA
jgi:TraX protein